MPKSGVFKNAKTIDLNTYKEIPINGLKKYYNRSIEISDTSVYILKKDLLRKFTKKVQLAKRYCPTNLNK